MRRGKRARVWGTYRRILRALAPTVVLILAVCLGLRTIRSNGIGMQASAEYSLRGLITAHGYSSIDMLGPVPLELPLIIDHLYRGRTLTADDLMLFAPRVLGPQVKLQPMSRPTIAPALGEAVRHMAVRQLVYNPFSYSDHVRLGETPSRTAWPIVIRFLPPRVISQSPSPVVVTEIDGVVYFIPGEWLDYEVPLDNSVLDGKLVEPLLITLLWFVGWCFVRWASIPSAGIGLSIGAAFPVGMGLWALAYWLSRACLGRSAVLGEIGVFFSLFSLVSVAMMFLSNSLRADLRSHSRLVVSSLSAIFVLSLILIRCGSYIPTVDSFRLLSSENSPIDSLALGFPLVLSAVGALGVVTENGFVGTVFPLMLLSLVVITAVAFHRFEALYPSRWSGRLVGALLLVVFFCVTPMARLQFTYVNGHVFHASCLLLLILVLLESRSATFSPLSRVAYTLLVFVLALLVSMSRMEGSLMLVVLLVSLIFSGLRVGVSTGRHLVLVVALAAVGWGGVTCLALDTSAFVSSAQYVVISALAALLGVLSLVSPGSVGCRWLSTYGVRLMVFSTMMMMYAAHMLKPSHMGISTLNALSNLFFSGGGWGYLWWWVVGIVVMLFGVTPEASPARDTVRYGMHRQALTVLLSFVMMAFVVTLVIGLFRQPYREGWSDSANRIIFQLVPVFLVWLYGVLGLSLHPFRKSGTLS